MADNCRAVYVGLCLTTLALLISVCLNCLLFYLRRRDRQNRDVDEPLCPDYFQSTRLEEQERINQDNPIYGNILFDGTQTSDSYVTYEYMTKRKAPQDETASPSNINYASLDLKAVQKRKKKRKYHQKQSHQVRTHAQQSSLDVGAECDPDLPSRTCSLMVSRSSIYLNSHQVALEAEELEREREREWERDQGREMDIVHLRTCYDHDLSQSEAVPEQGP